VTHCLLNLFVFIYSPPPYAATCSRQHRGLAAIYRRASARLASSLAKGHQEWGEIIFLTLLAKEKSTERSFWHRNCVARIFNSVQVSAQASHQHPVPHQHSTPHSTGWRVETSDSTSYTASSAGERETEKIKGWEAQMVSLGTINALIKGH